MKRVLFFAPHADDIEAFCPSTCKNAVARGFEVHEILTNSDEYGTLKKEFRGRRIARIRRSEMKNAAKMYGVHQDETSKIILHWLHYIDGFVPFDQDSVAQFRRLIEKIQPSIIFGPDPFFPIDLHTDHINTGRNFYYAIKSIPEKNRPKHLFFYQSYFPNTQFPYSSGKFVLSVRAKHRSQAPPILWKIFTIMDKLSKRIGPKPAYKGDHFRKVQISNEINQINKNKWSILKRLQQGIWFYWMRNIFGYQDPDYYSEPPMDSILKDYERNGWVLKKN